MADPDHIRRVMEGVAAWNEWRSEDPNTQVDLSSADLRDAELDGGNLRYANLSSCDLRDAALNNADMSSAVLRGADLRGAQLYGAALGRADFTGARLDGVNASDADFGEANMTGVRSLRSNLTGANFAKATCKDSRFIQSDLTRGNLTQTDFRDSDMNNTNFAEASLAGADLRRCQLNSASFTTANLSNAKLNRADLNHADLTDAKLTHSDLRGVTGLHCEQLTKAQDWATAYRDAELACDAAIPSPVDVSVGLRATVETKLIHPPLVELFENGLSRWRDDVPEGERRSQLEKSRRALDELEKALTGLRHQPEHGQIGHNMPPEPIVPDDVIDQCIAEVRVGIALHDAPRPDKARLSHLRDVLGRFRAWLQPRIDKAADSAAIALGAALAAKVSGAWEQLAALIRMLI